MNAPDNAQGQGPSHGPSHAGDHGGDHAGDEHVIPKDLPRPGAMTVVALVAAFVVLLAALFLIGLIPGLKREHETRADAEEKASDAPIVSTTQPALSAVSKDIILPCDVRAFADTSIFPRANGYLKKWYVDIQDHVKAGQLLAEIDTPDVDAQLDQSKAALEQNKAGVTKAQSDLALAQKTLDRYQEAQRTTKGAVTEEDLDTRIATRDQAAAALEQAKANVVAAAADVARMQTMQNFEKIIAPFSGTVTFRGYDVGALLNPTDLTDGKEIFRIQQTDPLKVYVSVPQTFASQIRTGQPAYLKVRNYGQKEFAGVVTRTTSSLDPSTRTMSFELDFPNKDSKLYPGMYGQVRLGITETRPTVTIPSSALVFNATGTQVAIVKDGKSYFQNITIGRDLGTELEVVDGVTNDDQIISNPGERLTEGGEVQITSKDK